MNELTISEALQIIGESLADESLKLSQKNHLLNIAAYQLIKKELTKEPEVKK